MKSNNSIRDTLVYAFRLSLLILLPVAAIAAVVCSMHTVGTFGRWGEVRRISIIDTIYTGDVQRALFIYQTLSDSVAVSEKQFQSRFDQIRIADAYEKWLKGLMSDRVFRQIDTLAQELNRDIRQACRTVLEYDELVDYCRFILDRNKFPMYVISCQVYRRGWEDACAVMPSSYTRPQLEEMLMLRRIEAHGHYLRAIVSGGERRCAEKPDLPKSDVFDWNRWGVEIRDIPVYNRSLSMPYHSSHGPDYRHDGHPGTKPDDGLFGFDPWDDEDDAYDIERMMSDPYL